VTSSLAVLEAGLWVKSIYMIKIMVENQKKDKIWKSKKFYINIYIKYSFKMEFTAC